MRTIRLPIKLLRDRRGATALEYGLIVALIVIVAMVGIAQLGGSNGGAWGRLANKVGPILG